ncbi:MAG TPA: hypothetical protein DEQ25_13875 [Methylophaga sp.]|mgnify:CR=1|jgi:hypothetical protein|nr:hypothetical protein [Methylophaga sp.]MBP23887.1 hypothetical protein [Methylophaga sp.]HCC82286.1 hypothetical protein [Methylophaga sp.]
MWKSHRRLLSSGLLLFAFSATVWATDPEVTDARLRLLPGKLPAAGYFKLSNASEGKLPITGWQRLNRFIAVNGNASFLNR